MIRYGTAVLSASALAVLLVSAGCESTPTKTEPAAYNGTYTYNGSGAYNAYNGTVEGGPVEWRVETPEASESSSMKGVMADPVWEAVLGSSRAAEGGRGAPAPQELTMGGMCAGQSADLPQAANSGSCFAKVWNEPKYTTVPQRRLVQAAGERTEVVPARYEKAHETVIVTPASKKYRTIPAQYETVTEQMLVRPAYVRTDTIPAMYDIIEEKVLVKPAYKTWKPGKMTNIQRVDESGQILCLVDVPAEYKTVTRREPRTQEQTKNIQVPAEYASVQKTVVKTPERVEEIDVPAVTEMRTYDKLVEAPKQVKVPVEAKYEDVPTQQLAEKGCYAWRQILCDNNMTQDTITKLQRALGKNGYYQGQPTGKFDDATLAAVNSYEKANNLPIDGYLNIETATRWASAPRSNRVNRGNVLPQTKQRRQIGGVAAGKTR